jgi:hypothetical protein
MKDTIFGYIAGLLTLPFAAAVVALLGLAEVTVTVHKTDPAITIDAAQAGDE